MSAASADPAPHQPPDLAEHFARIVTDRHLKAGRALASALALPRGGSVLELGSGTGLLSEYLADCVGLEGDVLGLDPSPYHMLIAHQRSRTNLRFQVGSPQQLNRFPEACFDVILANDLLQTWPDHPGPLHELHRMLKPGGRLGLVTPSKDHPHPASVIRQAVLAREPYANLPPSPETHEHLLNATQLEALLREAGFASVQVDEQPDEITHASANAAIEFVQACSWGNFLNHLPRKPADLQTQARAEIAQGLERLRTEQGIRHKGVRLFAIATKASARPNHPTLPRTP